MNVPHAANCPVGGHFACTCGATKREAMYLDDAVKILEDLRRENFRKDIRIAELETECKEIKEHSIKLWGDWVIARARNDDLREALVAVRPMLDRGNYISGVGIVDSALGSQAQRPGGA